MKTDSDAEDRHVNELNPTEVVTNDRMIQTAQRLVTLVQGGPQAPKAGWVLMTGLPKVLRSQAEE